MSPFVGGQQRAGSSSGNKLCIPDANDNAFVCMAAFERVQRNINGPIGIPGGEIGRRDRRRAFVNWSGAVSDYSAACLRGGSRAGIMDLGDLVVSDAEHLAQDLVGVLAEQRRTPPRSVSPTA